MEKHAKLPSTLSIFSNFLLGEIFSQVRGLCNPHYVFNCFLRLKSYVKKGSLLKYLIIATFQDPLRASDKALTSCGPYKMKEEDAMVYRRPYLTSGSSGFALNAISRAMSKELKVKSLFCTSSSFFLSFYFYLF